MKKTLLLQTALVASAAVLLTDIASAQTKAEPIGVTVGGYMTRAFKVQDRDDTPAHRDRTSNTFGAPDAEIWFNIRAMLDNGLLVGGRVELEGATDSDQIDESYMFLERADIGRVEVGSTDRAASKMLYGAPSALPNIGTVDPAGNTNVINAPVGARTTGPLSKFAGIDDSEGINLYTSANRYFGSKAGKGLQFGFSYVPDGCQDYANSSGALGGSGTNTCAAGFGTTNDAGQLSKAYTFAANYLESFGPVDVALYAGYNRFNIEGTNGGTAANGSATIYQQSGLEGYAAGTTLTYNVGDGSTVQIGGAYKIEETGSKNPATGIGGDDRQVYSVGLKYLTNGTRPGSIGLGVDYSHSKTDQGNIAGVAVGGEDKFTWYSAGVSYQLASGILLFGGLGQYDFEDAVAAGTVVGVAQANNEAKATFGIVGARLDF